MAIIRHFLTRAEDRIEVTVEDRQLEGFFIALVINEYIEQDSITLECAPDCLIKAKKERKADEVHMLGAAIGVGAAASIVLVGRAGSTLGNAVGGVAGGVILGAGVAAGISSIGAFFGYKQTVTCTIKEVFNALGITTDLKHGTVSVTVTSPFIME